MSNLLNLYDGREKKGSKSQSHSMASKGDLYTERELRRKEAYPLIDNNIIKLTHRSNVLSERRKPSPDIYYTYNCT